MQIIFKIKKQDLETLLQIPNDRLDLTSAPSGTMGNAEGGVDRQRASHSEVVFCLLRTSELLYQLCGAVTPLMKMQHKFSIEINPSTVCPLYEGYEERSNFAVPEHFGVFPNLTIEIYSSKQADCKG